MYICDPRTTVGSGEIGRAGVASDLAPVATLFLSGPLRQVIIASCLSQCDPHRPFGFSVCARLLEKSRTHAFCHGADNVSALSRRDLHS